MYTGSILFGGVDPSLYSGTLTSVPVISSKCALDVLPLAAQLQCSGKLQGSGERFCVPRYWMLPLLGVRIGGLSVSVTARGAILASGSALNLLTARDFLYLGAVPCLGQPPA
jgi:hypothetical protein